MLQKNDQYTEQNGATTDGRFNQQNAENVNNQRQVIDSKRNRRGYGRLYRYRRRNPRDQKVVNRWRWLDKLKFWEVDIGSHIK